MAASRRPDAAKPPAVIEDPCRPELDPIDALRVGQTLRMLAFQGRVPAGAAESCERVGAALVNAAHEKFNERNRKRGG